LHLKILAEVYRLAGAGLIKSFVPMENDISNDNGFIQSLKFIGPNKTGAQHYN